MEKLYDVLPGFDWVAGRRVPDERQVSLTDIEAAFDLGLGRIELAPPRPTPSLAGGEVAARPAVAPTRGKPTGGGQEDAVG